MSACATERKGKASIIGGLYKGAKDKPRLSPEVVAALEEFQYNRGFKAGQKNMFDSIVTQSYSCEKLSFDEMRCAAEIFYQRLIHIVPPEDILEYRLGCDIATGSTAILAIISRRYDKKMADITDLAGNCEMDIFDKFKYNCYFWVITDEKLDKPLIERDFPYVRARVSNVNGH